MSDLRRRSLGVSLPSFSRAWDLWEPSSNGQARGWPWVAVGAWGTAQRAAQGAHARRNYSSVTR